MLVFGALCMRPGKKDEKKYEKAPAGMGLQPRVRENIESVAGMHSQTSTTEEGATKDMKYRQILEESSTASQ